MRYYSNLPESLMRDATMAAIKNGWYPSVPLWTQGTPAYNPGPMPLGDVPMYLNGVPTFLNQAPESSLNDNYGDLEVYHNMLTKRLAFVSVALLGAYVGYKYYKKNKQYGADLYA